MSIIRGGAVKYPQQVMSNRRRHKIGDSPAPAASAGEERARRRRLLADFCRLMDPHARRVPPNAKPQAAPPWDDPRLAPRVRQTLRHLLEGDSEKQIAAKLAISAHTVHVYVKALHRHYRVSSRGELLARFVAAAAGSGASAGGGEPLEAAVPTPHPPPTTLNRRF